MAVDGEVRVGVEADPDEAAQRIEDAFVDAIAKAFESPKVQKAIGDIVTASIKGATQVGDGFGEAFDKAQQAGEQAASGLSDAFGEVGRNAAAGFEEMGEGAIGAQRGIRGLDAQISALTSTMDRMAQTSGQAVRLTEELGRVGRREAALRAQAERTAGAQSITQMQRQMVMIRSFTQLGTNLIRSFTRISVTLMRGMFRMMELGWRTAERAVRGFVRIAGRIIRGFTAQIARVWSSMNATAAAAFAALGRIARATFSGMVATAAAAGRAISAALSGVGRVFTGRAGGVPAFTAPIAAMGRGLTALGGIASSAIIGGLRVALSASYRIFAQMGGALSSALGAAASSVAGALRGAFNAAGLLTGIIAGTALVGGARRLVALENAATQMELLLGSTEDVRTAMDALDRVVTGTAFGLDEGAGAMARMISAGTGLEDIEGMMSLIADATAFTVGRRSLDEVATIFSTIASGATVSREQLNQLRDAGIPAMQILAAGLGTTVEDLNENWAEMALGPAEFFEAWEQGVKGFGENGTVLEGMAQQMGETTAGAFSLMRSAMDRLGAQAIRPLFELARPFFLGMRGGFDSLTGRVEAFSDSVIESQGFANLQESMTRLPEAMSGLIDRAFEMRRVVGPLFAAVFARGTQQIRGMLGPLGRIIPAINPVVAAIATAIAMSPELREAFGNVARELGPALGQIAQAAGQAFSALSLGLAEVLVTIAPVVVALAGLVTAIVNLGRAIGGDLIGRVLALFGSSGALAGAGNRMGSIVDSISSGIDTIRDWMGEMQSLVEDGRWGEVFDGLTVAIARGLSRVFGLDSVELLSAMSSGGNRLLNVLEVTFLGPIVRFFRNTVPAAISGAISVVTGAIAGVVSAVQGAIATLFGGDTLIDLAMGGGGAGRTHAAARRTSQYDSIAQRIATVIGRVLGLSDANLRGAFMRGGNDFLNMLELTFLGPVVRFFRGPFMDGFNAVVGFITETLAPGLVSGFTAVLNFFRDTLIPIGASVINFFRDDFIPLVGDFGRSVWDFLEPAFNAIGSAISTAWDIVRPVIQPFVDALETLWDAIRNLDFSELNVRNIGIGAGAGGILGLLLGGPGGALLGAGAGAAVGALWDGIAATIANGAGVLIDAFQGVLDTVSGWVTDNFTGTGLIGTGLDFLDLVRGVASAIVEAFTSPEFVGILSAAITAIAASITLVLGAAIVGAIEGLQHSVKNWAKLFAGLMESAWDAIADFMYFDSVPIVGPISKAISGALGDESGILGLLPVAAIALLGARVAGQIGPGIIAGMQNWAGQTVNQQQAHPIMARLFGGGKDGKVSGAGRVGYMRIGASIMGGIVAGLATYNFAKDLGQQGGGGNLLMAILTGGGTGALIGSFLPAGGTAIGAGIGAAIGGIGFAMGRAASQAEEFATNVERLAEAARDVESVGEAARASEAELRDMAIAAGVGDDLVRLGFNAEGMFQRILTGTSDMGDEIGRLFSGIATDSEVFADIASNFDGSAAELEIALARIGLAFSGDVEAMGQSLTGLEDSLRSLGLGDQFERLLSDRLPADGLASLLGDVRDLEDMELALGGIVDTLTGIRDDSVTGLGIDPGDLPAELDFMILQFENMQGALEAMRAAGLDVGEVLQFMLDTEEWSDAARELLETEGALAALSQTAIETAGSIDSVDEAVRSVKILMADGRTAAEIADLLGQTDLSTEQRADALAEVLKAVQDEAAAARAEVASLFAPDQVLDFDRALRQLRIATGREAEGIARALTEGIGEDARVVVPTDIIIDGQFDFTNVSDQAAEELESFVDFLQSELASAFADGNITDQADFNAFFQGFRDGLEQQRDVLGNDVVDLLQAVTDMAQADLTALIVEVDGDTDAFFAKLAEIAEGENVVAEIDTIVNPPAPEQWDFLPQSERVLHFTAEAAAPTLPSTLKAPPIDISSATTSGASYGDSFAAAVAPPIQGGFDKAMAAAEATVSTAAQTIPDSVSELAPDMTAAFQVAVVDTGESVLSGAAGTFATGGQHLMNSVILGAASRAPGLAGVFLSALAGAANAVSAGAGVMANAGQQLMNGLTIGIVAGAQRAANAARQASLAVISAARSTLGIASPSKVFRTIGRDVGRGFVEAIRDGASTMQTALTEAITDAVTAATEASIRVVARSQFGTELWNLLTPSAFPGGLPTAQVSMGRVGLLDEIAALTSGFRDRSAELLGALGGRELFDATTALQSNANRMVGAFVDLRQEFTEASRARQRGEALTFRQQSLLLGPLGSSEARFATGAQNRQIIADALDQVREWGVAAIQSGRSTASTITEMNRYISSLQIQSAQFGITQSAFNGIRNQLGLTNAQLQQWARGLTDLSTATAQGRQNMQQLTGQLQAIREFGSTLISAGTAGSAVVQQMQAMRNSLLQQATAAGFSSSQINALVTQVGLSNTQLQNFVAQLQAFERQAMGAAAAAEQARREAQEEQREEDAQRITRPAIENLNLIVPHGDPEAIGLAVLNRLSYQSLAGR